MFKELIDRTLTSAGGERERSYGDKLCLISIDLINKQNYTPVSSTQ